MSLLSPHYRALLCIAALSLSLGGYLHPPAFLQKLTLPIEDSKLGARSLLGADLPMPPAEIIIVTIDEPSINTYGRWPWSRKVMAELVTNLRQASVIGFDIIFSEPAAPAEDQALATSLQEAGNTVLGFFFRQRATGSTAAESLDLLENCAYPSVDQQSAKTAIADYPFVEVNIPTLAEAATSCGSINIAPDRDGLYRHYPLGLLHKGYLYPPLAIQSLQYHWNTAAEITVNSDGMSAFSLGERSIENSGALRLNFYGNNGTPFKTVSASAVLNHQYPEGFFTNSLVLLGITEIGIFDVRPTPVNVAIPGIFLHATALANLLDGNILKDSRSVDIVLIVVSLLAVALISLLPGIWQRYLGYLAILPLPILAGWIALISQQVWIREFYALAGMLILAIALEIVAYRKTERRAVVLKRAFASYVSPELIKRVSRDPEALRLGGESRQITTLFSDIRGFTGISEKYQPFQVVQLLNEIHDPLTEIIMKHQGMLDKYIGDAMMVLYNAPLNIENHPDKAIASALDMIDAMAVINRKLAEQNLPAIEIGIGISTGECIVGNMGSRSRFAYTAIGDPVNLAARLEGLCKLYKVPIIFSGQTRDGLEQDWLVRRLDRVRVSGKETPVEIFQVLARTEKNLQLAREFQAAQQAYFCGNFKEARTAFALLAEGGDQVSGLFAARCDDHIRRPPAADWNGVYVVETK